jgi:hypothetical protein
LRTVSSQTNRETTNCSERCRTWNEIDCQTLCVANLNAQPSEAVVKRLTAKLRPTLSSRPRRLLNSLA